MKPKFRVLHRKELQSGVADEIEWKLEVLGGDIEYPDFIQHGVLVAHATARNDLFKITKRAEHMLHYPNVHMHEYDVAEMDRTVARAVQKVKDLLPKGFITNETSSSKSVRSAEFGEDDIGGRTIRESEEAEYQNGDDTGTRDGFNPRGQYNSTESPMARDGSAIIQDLGSISEESGSIS